MNTFKQKALFILLIGSLILIGVITFITLEEYYKTHTLYFGNIAALFLSLMSASLFAYSLYRIELEQEMTN